MNLMFNAYVTKKTFNQFLDYMKDSGYEVVRINRYEAVDVEFHKEGKVDHNYQAASFKIDNRTKYLIGNRAH